MKRDLTAIQFKAAVKRHGFTPVGFMGYYEIGNGLTVSVLNAGPNRRAQLSYLIAKHEEGESRHKKAGSL